MLCKYCKKERHNLVICPHCGISNNKGVKTKIYHDESMNDNSDIKNFLRFYKKPIKWITNILFFCKYGFSSLVMSFFLIFGIICLTVEFVDIVSNQRTIGTLLEFIECDMYGEDELCQAVYEYEVDGKKYTVSPDLITDKESFDMKETVYYEKKNPEDATMNSGWDKLILVSIFCLVLIIIRYLKVHNDIKNATK